jgi:hypothetical protein
MTHPPDRVFAVHRLAGDGLTAVQISRLSGVPRRTVCDWLAGRVPRGAQDAGAQACDRCGGSHAAPDALPPRYAYLLGLYLGDGCISAHPRGVYRLRIKLDARYPLIIEEAAAATREVMPHNAVGLLAFRDSWVEVGSYSKAWPCLFPQHGPGRKHARRIVLEPWQSRLVREHPELLLRGLIHSDGCRFINTSRNWRQPRYAFDNRSSDIRRIFCDACDMVGLRWTTAKPYTVYVSRKPDVARLDEFVGPKA